MVDELFEILNNNQEYINNYIILKIEDLYNVKKINFYFILLKYIVKKSFYIYNIPLLLKTRKTLLKIVKYSKKDATLILLKQDKERKRLEYIINKIIDSKYYLSHTTKDKNTIQININNNNMQEKNITMLNSCRTKIIKDDDIMKFSLFLDINFLNIMGKHEKTSEYIKEISNEYFISGGLNNIFVYNGIVEPKKMKKNKKR